MTIRDTSRVCRACHVKGAAKRRCDNPPAGIAYHRAACVAWASRCGVEADFVEVKR